MTRAILEAGAAHHLFTTKEPHKWKSALEDLGKLCGEIWRDDLPEQDRAWAEARREELGKWVDGRPAPPWPMLLAAVRRAYLSYREIVSRQIAGTEPDSEAERLERLSRTHLWKTLTAEDIGQGEGPEALRAFQRGFRVGRRNKAGSIKYISPVLEPHYHWYGYAFKHANLPGPTAARERALLALWGKTEDFDALKRELRELYATAWRDDVPEEDREWAQEYREFCTDWINRPRLDAMARAAYEAYLQSSDGILDGKHVSPQSMEGFDSKPWNVFAERILDAPEDESEFVTAEAAAREYWDAHWRDAPPWDSDSAQAHWLAAARAARKTLVAMANHVPRR